MAKIKLTLLSFVFFFLILSNVNATIINNTDLYSSGLDLNISIGSQSWILDSVIVDTNFISIVNLTSSHASEQAHYPLTFNLTETNKQYKGTDMPFWLTDSQYYAVLYSNLTNTLPIKTIVNITDCEAINQLLLNNNSINWSCISNTLLNLTFNAIHGSNRIDWAYNYTPYNCTNSTMLDLDYIEGETNRSNLPDVDIDLVLSYWTNPLLQHYNLSYSTNSYFGKYNRDEKFKSSASTGHGYESVYGYIQPKKEGYLTDYCNDWYTSIAQDGYRQVSIRNSTGDDIATQVATYGVTDYCVHFVESDYSQLMKEGQNYTIIDFPIEYTTAGTYVYISSNPAIAEYDTFTYYSGSANRNIANNGYFNFKSKETSKPDGICLDIGTIHGDLYIKNTATDGFTNRFYLNNYTFTNTSTYDLTLYNYQTQTDKSLLDITVRNQGTFEYYPEVYVTLLRYYVGTNEWLPVQWDKTGAYGHATFHIQEQSTEYKLEFRDYAGNLLKAVDPMKFSCDSGVCDLTVLLNPNTVITYDSPVTASYTVTNNNIKFDWATHEGNNTYIQGKVTKETMGGTTDVCTFTSVDLDGSHTCNLSGISDTVYVRLDANDIPVIHEFKDLNETGGLSQFLDSGGQAIYSFIVLLAVLGIGFLSPFLGVIALIFGVLVLFYFGLLSGISGTVVILVAIMGLAIIIKTRGKSV